MLESHSGDWTCFVSKHGNYNAGSSPAFSSLFNDNTYGTLTEQATSDLP